MLSAPLGAADIREALQETTLFVGLERLLRQAGMRRIPRVRRRRRRLSERRQGTEPNNNGCQNELAHVVSRIKRLNGASQGCVFRGKSATHSGMKSATDSDLISAIPI